MVDWLQTIGYATSIAVAVVAVVVALRDRRHAAFALAAVWLAATDWLRIGVATFRAGAHRPLTGVARASMHVEELLVLSWSFATIALTLHYFTRIRPVWLLAPYAIAFAFCLDYPAMAGESLAVLYRTVWLAACLGSWCAIAWAMVFRNQLQPTVTHLLVMFWAAADVIINALPLASDFFRDWDMVRMANIVTALACIAAQGWQLTRPVARDEASP